MGDGDGHTGLYLIGSASGIQLVCWRVHRSEAISPPSEIVHSVLLMTRERRIG